MSSSRRITVTTIALGLGASFFVILCVFMIVWSFQTRYPGDLWFTLFWRFGPDRSTFVGKTPEGWLITWKVKGTTLFLNGREMPSHSNPYWTIGKLEDALRYFKESLLPPTTIEAISIGYHVAAGLWNEGTLTIEHLHNAKVQYDVLTVFMELDGDIYPVCIHEVLKRDFGFVSRSNFHQNSK